MRYVATHQMIRAETLSHHPGSSSLPDCLAAILALYLKIHPDKLASNQQVLAEALQAQSDTTQILEDLSFALSLERPPQVKTEVAPIPRPFPSLALSQEIQADNPGDGGPGNDGEEVDADEAAGKLCIGGCAVGIPSLLLLIRLKKIFGGGGGGGGKSEAELRQDIQGMTQAEINDFLDQIEQKEGPAAAQVAEIGVERIRSGKSDQ